MGIAIMSAIAALAIGLLVGLSVNLQKSIAMCERCKHEQPKCVACMASRATYE